MQGNNTLPEGMPLDVSDEMRKLIDDGTIPEGTHVSFVGDQLGGKSLFQLEHIKQWLKDNPGKEVLVVSLDSAMQEYAEGDAKLALGYSLPDMLLDDYRRRRRATTYRNIPEDSPLKWLERRREAKMRDITPQHTWPTDKRAEVKRRRKQRLHNR